MGGIQRFQPEPLSYENVLGYGHGTDVAIRCPDALLWLSTHGQAGRSPECLVWWSLRI